MASFFNTKGTTHNSFQIGINGPILEREDGKLLLSNGLLFSNDKTGLVFDDFIDKNNYTGNAATATKLLQSRTISLSGIISGSASFDGSANALINTTIDIADLVLKLGIKYNPKNEYIEFTGSSFDNDVTYYELIDGEYVETEDSTYNSSKTYYYVEMQALNSIILENSYEYFFPEWDNQGSNILATQDWVTNKGYLTAEDISNLNLSDYVKKSNAGTQEIVNTSGTTVTEFKSNGTTAYIGFKNSNGTSLGAFGVSATNKPVFNDGSDHQLAYVSDIVAPTVYADGSKITSTIADAQSGGNYSISLGSGSRTDNRYINNIAIGYGATTFGADFGIAIGSQAITSSEDYAIAIGGESYASKTKSVAIGYSANATAVNAIQLGTGTNNTANSLNFMTTPVVVNSKLAVKSGGTTGQALVKNSNTDYDYKWADIIVPTKTSDLTNDGDGNSSFATESFVNSSISTNTATFRGTYDIVTDLSLTASATESAISTALNTAVSTKTNNDYVFVAYPTTHSTTDFDKFDRYKYDGTDWNYEFTLNNSSFTSDQWSAVNSGITSSLVSKITANETAISGKQNTIDSSHKLSSDLVDDTNNTNKFVTSSEKLQITTNANAISAIKDGTSIDSFGDVETEFAKYINKFTYKGSITTNTYPSNPAIGDVYINTTSSPLVFGGGSSSIQSIGENDRFAEGDYIYFDDTISDSDMLSFLQGLTYVDGTYNLVTCNDDQSQEKRLIVAINMDNIYALSCYTMTNNNIVWINDGSGFGIQDGWQPLTTEGGLLLDYPDGEQYCDVTAVSPVSGWNGTLVGKIVSNTLTLNPNDWLWYNGVNWNKIDRQEYTPPTLPIEEKTVVLTPSTSSYSAISFTKPLLIGGGDSGSSSKIALDRSTSGQITNESTQTLFGWTANNTTNLTVGHTSYALKLRGSGTRPQFNGNDLALSSDLDDYVKKSPTSGQTISAPSTAATTSLILTLNTTGTAANAIQPALGFATNSTVIGILYADKTNSDAKLKYYDQISNATSTLITDSSLKTVGGVSLVGSGNVGFKTIAGNSIVGSGNIELKTINNQSIVGSGNLNMLYTGTTIAKSGTASETIEPQKMYTFTGSPTSLAITLGTPTSGVYPYYKFTIITGDNSNTLLSINTGSSGVPYMYYITTNPNTYLKPGYIYSIEVDNGIVTVYERSVHYLLETNYYLKTNQSYDASSAGTVTVTDNDTGYVKSGLLIPGHSHTVSVTANTNFQIDSITFNSTSINNNASNITATQDSVLDVTFAGTPTTITYNTPTGATVSVKNSGNGNTTLSSGSTVNYYDKISIQVTASSGYTASYTTTGLTNITTDSISAVKNFIVTDLNPTITVTATASS